MKKLVTLTAGLLLVASAVPVQKLQAQQNPEKKEKKAALFIFKRTNKVPDSQIKVLEDYLKAQVSDIGFQVLSRDVIIDSLDSVAGGKSSPDSLEAQLSKASSAMRLSQNMGANLILLATINSYSTETRNFKGNKLFPVPSKWHYHRLRLTYSLAFGANGAAMIGQKFMVERKIKETSGLVIEGDDLLDGLMERASEDLAAHITKAQRLLDPSEIPNIKSAEFIVNTKLVMPGGGPLVLPAIFIDGKRQQIEASVAADVILNGVSIGTAPAALRAPIGLSTIKVTRQGFKPYEKIINISPGLKLDLNLEMTDDGYRKWKEQIKFFQDLEMERKYVEADTERIKLEAEALLKHGLIMNVDTNEGINIQKKNIIQR